MLSAVVIAGVVGVLALLARVASKPAAVVAEKPPVSPWAKVPRERLTDVWELTMGGRVVAFRQELVDAIMAGLAYSAARPVGSPPAGLPKATTAEVVPLPPGAPLNARDTLLVAVNEAKLVVIGNEALADPGAGGRLVSAVPVAELEKFAAPGRGWAVLLCPAGTLRRKVDADEVPAGGVTDKPVVRPVKSTWSGVVDEPPLPPGVKLAGWEPVAEPPLPPGVYELDAHLSSELAAEAQKTLADPKTLPWELDELSAKFAAQGYSKTADAFKVRADIRRAECKAQAEAYGGWPVVWQATYTPQFVADWYTGDANRWGELSADAKLVALGTVLTPVSWAAWNKSAPPIVQALGPAPKVEPKTVAKPKSTGTWLGRAKAAVGGDWVDAVGGHGGWGGPVPQVGAGPLVERSPWRDADMRPTRARGWATGGDWAPAAGDAPEKGGW